MVKFEEINSILTVKYFIQAISYVIGVAKGVLG